ncbi:MAG TPA: TolC family protein [Bacteroidia bacterium]|nr:TolC family protein [Bacteroidia bacterium]
MKRILLTPVLLLFAVLTGLTASGQTFVKMDPAADTSLLRVVAANSDSALFPADNSQPWNLTQCIAYAQVHNITVQQQLLNVQLAQVNLRQSQGNMLPNVNGFASHTYQYGRTVDRFTNTFANSMVLSENFYLSSNWTVFNGMQNFNTMKQDQYALQGSRYQVQQTQDDIGMNVASAYLNVLYAQEALGVSQQQVDLTQAQVDRTQKLVDAGAAAKGSLLDLQSQLATEQVSLVTAQNNLTIAYLTLTQMMNLDSTSGFTIVKPIIDVPNESLLNTTPDLIFQAAMNNQAGIKKSQMDVKSADKGVDVAYGGLSPTVTIQGSIGTGYSGAAKTVTGTSYSGYDTAGVTTNGGYVLIPNYTTTYITTPFSDQFNNNVNKSFGVQVTVPIFNRFQVMDNVDRAKINYENAQLSLDLSQQQLMKNIQQAYADAQAALQKYQASQKAVDAAQESFNYTEQKFDVGAVNSIDYNNAKNKLTKAQSDLIQAKYDYIFRMKVLDYYQGKPLTF